MPVDDALVSSVPVDDALVSSVPVDDLGFDSWLTTRRITKFVFMASFLRTQWVGAMEIQLSELV